MKDYEKKMGITQMGDQTYRQKIIGIGRLGDLILYKKRCDNMKDFIKKRQILDKREIRLTKRNNGYWTKRRFDFM